MALTNFQNGVSSFGIPVIGPGGGDMPASGNYIFVSSSTGADGNPGTYDLPMRTLDAAIGRCVANTGYVIALMPGHAETVAAASGITLDVAGVTVVGMGEGASRPTFTFSATDSTIVISAAACQFGHKLINGENSIITKPSIDSVVTALSISGGSCSVFVEHQDASSTVENVTAVTAAATADNLILDLKYVGFTAGNAITSAIILDGLSNARVNVDFYGVVGTAVVQFNDTAVIDVNVTGYMYVSGITNFSRSVVDTATGSTWFASFYDGAAAAAVSGGSGGALAADDVAVVAAGQAVPSADATANALERDVIGNKTDAAVTEVGTTKSIEAYLKGLVGSMWASPICVAKTDGAVLSGTDPLFTITGGPVRCTIYGIVTTQIGAGTTNGKLVITTTTPAATVDMNAAAVDIDADAAGTSYRSINTTAIFTPVTAGFVMMGNAFATDDTEFLCPIGSIGFNSDAARAGVIAWYMMYTPLSPSSL